MILLKAENYNLLKTFQFETFKIWILFHSFKHVFITVGQNAC